MPNAPGYLADYLTSLAGDQRAEIDAALAGFTTLTDLVVVGDSFALAALDPAGAGFAGRYRPEAVPFWLIAKSKGALNWFPENLYAASGTTASQHLVQAQTFVSDYPGKVRKPNLALYHGPANSILNTAVTMTSIVSDVTAATALLGSKVNAVIMFTTHPRHDFDAAKRQRAHVYNDWLRTFARGNPKVVLIDFASEMTDWTYAASGFYPIGGEGAAALSTGLTVDGIHWSPKAAAAAAEIVWQRIRHRVRQTQTLLAGYSDLYDATNLPAGNLPTNGGFRGTSGSLGGTAGASGSVASSWSCFKSGGASETITLSKDVRTGQSGMGNLPTQRIKITQTGGARGTFSMNTTTVIPGGLSGQTISGLLGLRITNASGLRGVRLSTDALDGSSVSQMIGRGGGVCANAGDGTLFYPWPSVPDDYLVLPSMPLLVPATATRFMALIDVYYETTCDLDIEVFACDVRVRN